MVEVLAMGTYSKVIRDSLQVPAKNRGRIKAFRKSYNGILKAAQRLEKEI